MIQLRNVPDELHRALKVRAAQEGRSLSDYLIHELQAIASKPTTDELRQRLARRKPVRPSETPADTLRAIRDHR